MGALERGGNVAGVIWSLEPGQPTIASDGAIARAASKAAKIQHAEEKKQANLAKAQQLRRDCDGHRDQIRQSQEDSGVGGDVILAESVNAVSFKICLELLRDYKFDSLHCDGDDANPTLRSKLRDAKHRPVVNAAIADAMNGRRGAQDAIDMDKADEADDDAGEGAAGGGSAGGGSHGRCSHFPQGRAV